MIKKMLLLVGMALASIAYAAPGAAQAEAYWTHGEAGTVTFDETEALNVDLEAQFTSTVGTLKTQTTIYLAGQVWNSASSGMGEGRIPLKEVTTPGIVVGIPGFICTVGVTTPVSSWPLTLTTGEPGETNEATLDIEKVQLVYHYSHGCQTSGTPPTGAITGTLSAIAETNSFWVDLTLEEGNMTVFNSGNGFHVTDKFGQPVPAAISSVPTQIQLTSKEADLGVEQHDE